MHYKGRWVGFRVRVDVSEKSLALGGIRILDRSTRTVCISIKADCIALNLVSMLTHGRQLTGKSKQRVGALTLVLWSAVAVL